jgi:predicted TIM-barrel fold metal-dependent hydrolase
MQKIFDSHFHIIDKNFPLIENNGYMPDEFNIKQYIEAVKNYNVVGGAIVSGSFQAFDQSYLIHALKKMGSQFVGVTQIPLTISDNEIIKLHKAGVRAVRFNIKRGGSAEIKDLEVLGNRVYSLVNWHTEMYMDSKNIVEHLSHIIKLKKFSIDHLGLSNDGFKSLKNLVEKGCIVKATGFGRVNFDPIKAIKELLEINPNSIIFGTDLPSTRAPIPFSKRDIDLILNHFSDKEIDNIMYNNARLFYNMK